MEKTNNLWQNFQAKYELTEEQLNQFKKYAQLLQEWNQKINLTAMDSEEDIINYHFDDSLAVTKFVDFSNIHAVSDVGTGAGFPGIPVKIKYPELKVVLIEVTQKKINFLNLVIEELGLENIEVYPLNWLTFLRKTEYNIDLFFARASLHTDELLKVFARDSSYIPRQGSQPSHKAMAGAAGQGRVQLIYWASIKWEAMQEDTRYLKKIEKYKVGEKERQLIFFAK